MQIVASIHDGGATEQCSTFQEGEYFIHDQIVWQQDLITVIVIVISSSYLQY